MMAFCNRAVEKKVAIVPGSLDFVDMRFNIAGGEPALTDHLSKHIGMHIGTLLSDRHFGDLNCFRSYNCNLVGVEMEPDGVNLEKLEQAMREQPNVEKLPT